MSDEVKPISKKLIKVQLDTLHVRYIPVVTPVKLWNYDMSLSSSPHVELMVQFRRAGLNWKYIVETRYFKERIHRHRIGLSKWDKEKIMEHIKDRYKIFKSIKANGYKRPCKPPVQVLKKPFWMTRFGCKETFLRGPEIWNGAGRCAAAYVLGLDKIPVQLVMDARAPGDKGKFESKLRKVKGVWQTR